ncbi:MULTISPECIES: serine hydrolase domain-containing protein [unclassified Mucilaginibacter]|uniref:serine hydrolase domain-containing protein n=1 Tax=unclassified Mucilaginibacter TaxID=2617802 RepID=UPI002AC9ECB0|nr:MULTISPECIES: serine hydrolase domain-containing protein [unclassified Mucilaginibacter]MEB0280891.1 serine hydrolase domain-containing protein [Mucilaginibacter sp. 10B2]MEB0303268.1 serine hydrolase domain-containing protein [Mucilaginibacter sp. 5C4]WPX25636.1 serine hydrolase domain-containing protein [Mucilaginibacter sp. 5C4]
MKNIYLSFCFSVLSIINAYSQYKGHNNQVSQIDAIFNKYSKPNGPGCAVAVVKNGKVIFNKGYGKANLEYEIPITKESIFDVASVAKQFTGFAISTLVQQRKISLSDDIRKYLPEVPDFGHKITISDLLHHTSGLRDWPETLQAAGWRYEELCSFEDIMNMVKHQKELDFDPGTAYSYSNTGYNLLAAIVEKVTGQSFTTWTDEHIFKKMAMTKSFFLSDDNKLIMNEAYPYSEGGQSVFSKLQNVLTAYGSSSLYTNLNDLSKWVINLQNGLSMNDPVYTRMLETGLLNDGSKTNYGFGLEIGEDQGRKTVSHTGAWSGYRSVVRLYPKERLAIIILSNGNNDHMNVEGITELSRVFLPDHNKKPLFVIEKRTPELEVSLDLLNKYIGKYKWGQGEITFSLDQGQLQFQYTGENRFPLQALNDSTFMLTAAGLPVIFSKPITGQQESFIFKSKTGKQIIPFTPNNYELNDYCGTYYSTELFTQYTVDIQNGKLFIHHFRRGDFELSPDIDDTFNSDIGTIRFVKSTKNRTDGFTLSGSKVKNLSFNKRIL